MCGIVGRFNAKNTSNKDITKFLEKIAHRGTPALQNETYSQNGWTIGANRLAITSIINETQPYFSTNKNSSVVLNGEIYNFKYLLNKYALDDTNCDGTALARLLEAEGIAILNELDGIFAFIWINSKEDFAYAIIDHMGIKPLYYTKKNNEFIFASEIKALSFDKNIDKIEKLKLGSLLKIEWGKDNIPYISEKKQYFNMNDDSNTEPLSIKSLTTLLHKSVRSQVNTDKPIGIYLSGGLDSSTIYAIARQYHKNIIPLILDGENGVDGAFALKLCEHFGDTPIVGVTKNEDELFKNIPNIIKNVESFEPNLVRQSSVSIQIAELAKRAKVDIVLTGEGADELFCGYPDFKTNENWDELRYSFLEDLCNTQLKRVDRTSMFYTTEARVPFLTKEIIISSLQQKDKTYFFNKKTEKIILREAMIGTLPEWIRTRPKVVLSEGVGLKGNNPSKGLFASKINALVSDEKFFQTQNKFKEWNLRTKEEVYYFQIFHGYGYSKARFMQNRVVSNLVNTVE